MKSKMAWRRYLAIVVIVLVVDIVLFNIILALFGGLDISTKDMSKYNSFAKEFAKTGLSTHTLDTISYSRLSIDTTNKVGTYLLRIFKKNLSIVEYNVVEGKVSVPHINNVPKIICIILIIIIINYIAFMIYNEISYKRRYKVSR